MPFLISILIHSLVGIGVFWSSGQGDGKPGATKSNKGPSQSETGSKRREIISIDIQMVEPPKIVDKEKDPDGFKEVINNKVKCQSYFGGIGILLSNNMITEVFKGYPAAKSGCVEKDDIIHRVESDTGNIEGEIGKKVILTLIRSGVRIQCELIRGKICIKDI